VPVSFFWALQSIQLEALFMNPTSQKALFGLAVIILKGSGATLRGLFLICRGIVATVKRSISDYWRYVKRRMQ